jgi:hypothetical protein
MKMLQRCNGFRFVLILRGVHMNKTQVYTRNQLAAPESQHAERGKLASSRASR